MNDDELGEEALLANSEAFERDPGDVGAANLVGRSLEHLGRLDEAREHWELVVELQPANAIAPQRARNLRHRPKRPEGSSGEAMQEEAEIREYWDASTERMRSWLLLLAGAPGVRKTHPQIESALGWEALSVRAVAIGASRRNTARFDGRVPYHWAGSPSAQSGRFESWVDARQARVILELAGAGS